jgi:hypothetical protein
LQELTTVTQIGIFGLKMYASGNPGHTAVDPFAAFLSDDPTHFFGSINFFSKLNRGRKTRD